jgi:hypothetical protein
LWLLFEYREVDNLEGEINEIDNDIITVIKENVYGIDVLVVIIFCCPKLTKNLFSTAFDSWKIPSFTRLLRILLRVTAFLERESNGLERFRVDILDKFLMSWSTENLPSECMVS